MPFVLSFNVTKALYPLNQAKYVSRISSALVRNRQDETGDDDLGKGSR